MSVKVKIPKGLKVVNVEDGPLSIRQDEMKHILKELRFYKKTCAKQNTIIFELQTRIEKLEKVILVWFEERIEVTIPKATYDQLLQQKTVKPYYIIIVYSFYYYTALWQKTNKPKATVSYVAKGLKLSVGKVRESKKKLIRMGLIEQGQTRDKNKNFGGSFIQVKYFDALTESGRASKRKVNALSNNNKMTSKQKLDSSVLFFPSNETTISFPQKCSNRLYKKLEKKRKIMRRVQPHVWESHFRKLTTKVKQKRISKVLSWYLKHIGEEFVPKAYSASSFVDKFLQIEDAMKRDLKKNPPKPKKAKRVVRGNRVSYEYEYKQDDVD